MSRQGVPYGGILLTASIGLLGVLLNSVVPDMAFEIVLNVASLGILASWATIIICQLALYRRSQQGLMERPSFRMWGAPYTGYVTLVFLLSVLVLMAFNYPIGTAAIAGLGVLIPALAGGWLLVRGRVLQIAAEREGLPD
jgi:L-asparagine permease